MTRCDASVRAVRAVRAVRCRCGVSFRAVRAVRAVRCFVTRAVSAPRRTARGARGARGVCGAVFRDTEDGLITHNRFTALLDFVQDYLGEPASER